MIKKLINLFLLNFLWILFSLPLITVGSSTCAAYYVTLKIVGNEEYNVFKMFIKGFKQNFLQGILMWLISAICLVGFYFIIKMIIDYGEFNFLYSLILLIYSIFVIGINLFSYSLIARYTNSLKNIIKNSVALIVQNFKKSCFLVLKLIIEIGISIGLFILYKYSIILIILILPITLIYSICKVAKPIFNEIEKS